MIHGIDLEFHKVADSPDQVAGTGLINENFWNDDTGVTVNDNRSNLHNCRPGLFSEKISAIVDAEVSNRDT